MSTLREDIRRVIVRPVISEKSFQLVQAHNQYTFRVLDGAHKTEIRQAIEDLFDVTVTDVRTVSVQSKPKRRGYTKGRRPGWKKAIVELKPDHRATAEELLALCRDRLGGMKTPKTLDFVDTLPRSPVGKVLKKDLRARYWQGQARQI